VFIVVVVIVVAAAAVAATVFSLSTQSGKFGYTLA
jgi:hypothetical protein